MVGRVQEGMWVTCEIRTKRREPRDKNQETRIKRRESRNENSDLEIHHSLFIIRNSRSRTTNIEHRMKNNEVKKK